MRIYNSLTKREEAFMPFKRSRVGVYTCGPTVYDYVTIGNWRTYTLGDLMVRALEYLGYEVDYIMNITDVGHLTGDNLGDASSGEDRQEKAAKREGKSAWELAEFYTQDFISGYEKLNLSQPRLWCKATDHIKEQIRMLKQIQAHGYTYETSDGIYFDIGKYEADGYSYGQLSNLAQEVEARVEENPEKKDSRDFALWKFSKVKTKKEDEEKTKEMPERQMNWWLEGSKAGQVVTSKDWKEAWERGRQAELASVGFPGWHLECSAMSQKYLGDQFDIHIGGEDLKSTHHPNEIAQSEAATRKIPFVKYWMHGAFLTVDGGRMGKSLGNAYTLADVSERGFELMTLRYLYLTGHYRKPMNFTWDNLEGAAVALQRLKSRLAEIKRHVTKGKLTKAELKSMHKYRISFGKCLEDDLNIPKGLALLWEALKDEKLTYRVRVALANDFDKVLGLRLKKVTPESGNKLPQDLIELVEKRENARVARNFEQADKLRVELEMKGYEVIDTLNGTLLKRKKKN